MQPGDKGQLQSLQLQPSRNRLHGKTTQSLTEARDSSQTAFNTSQRLLVELKLVSHLERVTSYKYLGIWLDNKLTFGVHTDSLLKKTQTDVRLLFV